MRKLFKVAESTPSNRKESMGEEGEKRKNKKEEEQEKFAPSKLRDTTQREMNLIVNLAALLYVW